MPSLPPEVDAFAARLRRSSLADKVLCLLVFGSAVREQAGLVEDHDLCIVLDGVRSSELESLREFVKETLDASKTDLTIYDSAELLNVQHFRDVGNGAFALSYLAHATTLLGVNPFPDLLAALSDVDYRRSIGEKAADYVLRLRRSLVLAASTEATLTYFRKYISRIVLDLLLYEDRAWFAKLREESNQGICERGADCGLLPRAEIDRLFRALDEAESVAAAHVLLDHLTPQVRRLSLR
jgi:hypothetical protein